MSMPMTVIDAHPEGNVIYTYHSGRRIESLTKDGESLTYGYDGIFRNSGDILSIFFDPVIIQMLYLLSINK